VKNRPLSAGVASNVPAAAIHADTSRRGMLAAIRDYVDLTKPRLNLLVVVTSAGGFYLASNGTKPLLTMIAASIGTALVACGAAVLNQVLERDTDALMERTRMRPLPSGRVTPDDATIFGIALGAAGLGLLYSWANLLAVLLALATILIYLLIYTPLKRRSPLATFVGAVPGALPALIGWTAAIGTPSAGGWALFAIVFLWQVPHFMAIAWMFRDDYHRAGFPMLSVIDPTGRRAGREAVLWTAALVPVSFTPTIVGISGEIYAWLAGVLGIVLLALAIRFRSTRSDASARALFFGSITYLPLLWAAMMLAR
jgi:heme o synthase